MKNTPMTYNVGTYFMNNSTVYWRTLRPSGPMPQGFYESMGPQMITWYAHAHMRLIERASLLSGTKCRLSSYCN